MGGPHMPRIYQVNWFRKGASGAYLWPGYGENIHVLKWIVHRLEGKVEARETAIGLLPIEIEGAVDELLYVDEAAYEREYAALEVYFRDTFKDRFPPVLQKLLSKHSSGVQKRN